MANKKIELNILHLNDYVLMEIFEYLTATELWQVSRSCSRFYNLAVTKKLWKKVDLRDEPFAEEKVTFALRMVNELTKEVRLCSAGRSLEIAPLVDFGYHLNNTNLTILALENQKLCGNRIKLVNLPETLVELSLRKTYITFLRLFLHRGNQHLINLKVLILDQCFWVKTIMLNELSKYRTLEILSLYDCKHMNDIVSPVSLGGELGFCALRIFDCRFSPLGNHTLRSLRSKPTLQEIYFQDYPSSYFFEKGKRELDIAYGSPARNHSYLTDLDDIPMFDKETVKLFFGNTDCQLKLNVGIVSDEGVLVFHFSKHVEEPPISSKYKSILYKRPYKKCICFKNGPYFERSKGLASKMKSVKGRDLAKTENLLNKELQCLQDSTSRNLHVLTSNNRNQQPYDQNINATRENHYMGWVGRRDARNDYEVATLEHWDMRPLKTPFLAMYELTGYDMLQIPDEQPDSTSSEEKRKWENWNEETLRSKALSLFATDTTENVRLKRLSLRGYKHITDHTLMALAHLKLKLLDITFTSVTERGVKEFTKLNPQCRVVHESLCKCRPRMHF